MLDTATTSSEIDLTGLTPTQTSVHGGGVPERAVDGDTNGNWGGNSCTHTSSANNPWWRVHLPGRHMITKVVLYNRSDACSDRLSPVYVYVQESSADKLCGSYTTSSVDVPSLSFKCPTQMYGDILWVEVRGTSKVLTLCEVRVFGWKL